MATTSWPVKRLSPITEAKKVGVLFSFKLEHLDLRRSTMGFSKACRCDRPKRHYKQVGKAHQYLPYHNAFTIQRWWTYQMWVTFYPEIDRPVYMPAHVADKIESLTYVEDVAQAVLKVIEKGEQVWDEAYNIALEEEFTLANILLRMRDGLGMKEVLGDSEDSEKSFYLYPTVFSGNMDISKAKKMLDFAPTPADRAFEETLAFYKKAFVDFPEERDEVLTELFKTAVPKKNRDLVYLAIDRELGKEGKIEEKFARKKKGDLGGLPTKTKDREEL